MILDTPIGSRRSGDLPDQLIQVCCGTCSEFTIPDKWTWVPENSNTINTQKGGYFVRNRKLRLLQLCRVVTKRGFKVYANFLAFCFQNGRKAKCESPRVTSRCIDSYHFLGLSMSLVKVSAVSNKLFEYIKEHADSRRFPSSLRRNNESNEEG